MFGVNIAGVRKEKERLTAICYILSVERILLVTQHLEIERDAASCLYESWLTTRQGVKKAPTHP